MADEHAGTLHVCATPIGNLADATPRLREALAHVDVIACEDTRRTRALLSALGIPAPRLISHRKDNEREGVAGVLRLLEEGADVALVSDAGTPAVVDPGVPLVREAHARGITVECVAGPSALAAALSVAGMSGRAFSFVGFLPRQQAELQDLVVARASDVIVGFEAPGRVAGAIGSIAAVQPGRRVCIARELTKRHEQVEVATASELAARLAGTEVRGEIVLVMDAVVGNDDAGQPGARSVALVDELVGVGIRRKDACRIVGRHDGVSANALYELTLER